MVRLWHRVLFASASVSVLLAPAWAGCPVYLALGDSGSFGETSFLPANYGDQGCVRPFADHLGSAYFGGERTRVLNLAVPAEMSGRALTGTPTPRLALAVNSPDAVSRQVLLVNAGNGYGLEYVLLALLARRRR